MSTQSKASKAQETHLGTLLNQFMYAVIKDHNNESDRLDPCKSMLYQTYDNLIRAKDDPNKAEGTENRFSIQTEVKQHLAYILRSVTELSRVALADDAKIADIIQALLDEFQDDSIAAPFLQFGVTYSSHFRDTLKNSVDETNWIQAQVIGMLPILKTKLHLVAEITTAIDKSVRAIAWVLGRGVWFGAEKSVSSEMFIYTLSLPSPVMYSLNTLDSISKEIRPKAARAVKAKTSKAATEVSTPITGPVVKDAVDAANNSTVSTVDNTSASVDNIVASGETVNTDIAAALAGI